MPISSIVNGIFGMMNTAIQNRYNQAAQAQAHHYDKEILGLTQDFNAEEAEKARSFQRQFYEDYMTPEAQIAQLKSAGLSPALMYAKGMGSVGQTAPTASMGASSSSSRTSPLGVGLVQPHGGNLINDLMNIEEMKNKIEERQRIKQQTALWKAEEEQVKATTKAIEKDVSLKNWNAGKMFTVSGSELTAFQNGKQWSEGWSRAAGINYGYTKSDSKSHSEGYQNAGGASIGNKVGIKIIDVGGNISANGAHGENVSDATSTSRGENVGINGAASENAMRGESHGQTYSTSEMYNVYVYPSDNPNEVNMIVIGKAGKYEDISIDLRTIQEMGK